MSTIPPVKAPDRFAVSEAFEQFLPQAKRAAQKKDEKPYTNAEPDAKAPPLDDYRAIGAPGEVAADTIRFETQAGKRVIVLKSTSPGLYEQVKKDYETLKTINEAVENGDRRVGKGDKAPEGIRDYRQVETLSSDVLRFRNNHGDWSVVARGDNPDFFRTVETAKSSLDGIKASEKDGYRRAGDNESWPTPAGIQVGAVDEVGPGLIRFDKGDEKVVVHKDDNPKLFGYLAGLREMIMDPSARDALNAAVSSGYELVRSEGDAPRYNDLKFITWSGELGENGVISYETTDGKKAVVTETLSPEQFARLKAFGEVMSKANQQEKEGYSMLEPGDYLTSEEIAGATIGPEGEVGDGFVRAEIFDAEGGSRKVIISRELSPDLYDRVVAEDNGRRYSVDKIDEVRGAADLPRASDFDIGSMETREKDPNDKNHNLTVSELTWQKVVEGWKKGIEDGSIKPDDDRAKLFRALRAQGALENGLDMVTLDISKGQATARTHGEDFESIIDGRKLDEQVITLFSTDSVQKDFLEAQKSALDSLPNKDEVIGKLEKMAFSVEYVKYINELRKDPAKKQLAEADIRETYAALAVADPEKAAQFAQQLQMDAVMIDVDSLMQNPDLITDDNLAIATADTVKTWLTALKKAGVDIPRRTTESIDKFVNEFLKDKQTAKDFGKALQELGDRYRLNGEITQADIDGLLKKDVYKALNEKTNGGMLSTIAELNKNGALGSAGGMISLASAVYQMAGGKLGGTSEERLAIAKELVSFFGASQHFVNLGTNIIDGIKGTDLNSIMALDKSLPQIFGDDKAKGKGPANPNFEAFREQATGLLLDASVDTQNKLNTVLNVDDAGKENILKGMQGEYAKNPAIKGANLGTKSISAFLRVLDAGANTFVGAADVALGALMIKDGKKKGDDAIIAQGAITVAAGSFGLGGGLASFGALKGLSIAKAATGPLFWLSAAMTIATLPFMIIEDIKYNKKLDDYRDDTMAFFQALDADGVLTEDGLTRYEFLDDYMHSYGQRDAPDDETIFDFREDEYEYFTERGHTYWDGQHEDYKGDGPNLDTLMDRGSTVGS